MRHNERGEVGQSPPVRRVGKRGRTGTVQGVQGVHSVERKGISRTKAVPRSQVLLQRESSLHREVLQRRAAPQ